MRRCWLAVCFFAFWLMPIEAQGQAHDPWWGPDKALHLSLSVAISAGGYGVAIPLLEQPETRVVFAAALGLSAGIGKELFDLAGYGDPSWKDLAWDAIGVAIGTVVMWTLDRLLSDRRPRPVRSSVLSAVERPALARVRF